ncbi:hypothetical protein HK405_000854, partial [Cladochytrium tenue]
MTLPPPPQPDLARPPSAAAAPDRPLGSVDDADVLLDADASLESIPPESVDVGELHQSHVQAHPPLLYESLAFGVSA